MQIVLPPKEAQGKVRQSQGRAPANNFALSRVRVREFELHLFSFGKFAIVLLLRYRPLKF